MKRKVSEVIAELNSLPLDAEINVINVWSNGHKIRRRAGQGAHSTWHNPRDGYRNMHAILLEGDAE